MSTPIYLHLTPISDTTYITTSTVGFHTAIPSLFSVQLSVSLQPIKVATMLLLDKRHPELNRERRAREKPRRDLIISYQLRVQLSRFKLRVQRLDSRDQVLLHAQPPKQHGPITHLSCLAV